MEQLRQAMSGARITLHVSTVAADGNGGGKGGDAGGAGGEGGGGVGGGGVHGGGVAVLRGAPLMEFETAVMLWPVLSRGEGGGEAGGEGSGEGGGEGGGEVGGWAATRRAFAAGLGCFGAAELLVVRWHP